MFLVLTFIGLMIYMEYILACFLSLLEEEERHELYTKNKRSE
nr:MAG TPA: hypothetical protein [Caudoviricetes sp.]